MAQKASTTRRYSPRRPREERREQLLDAALRLFDGHGFYSISIEGVAREAGLTKSVVYATFGTREELLQALVDRELDRTYEDISGAIPPPPYSDPEAVLREALVSLLHAVRARPETWRMFVLPADGMPIEARQHVLRQHRRLLDELEPLIAWGLKRLGAENVDTEVMTRIMVACFDQAIRMTLTEPDRFPPERLVAFAEAFIATLVPLRAR